MRLSIHPRIQAMLQAIRQRIKRKVLASPKPRKEPESPEDPYAYVTARVKPRTPHRGAAAVAEWPED